jgi:hypothetical protein
MNKYFNMTQNRMQHMKIISQDWLFEGLSQASGSSLLN